MQLAHKDFVATLTKTGAFRFTAIISTDSIDRDGEVLVPSGMNSKDYERNPVVLYAHDAARPIGRILALSRENHKIAAEFELAKRPEDHDGEWFPDFVRGLIESQALRGISVGYQPIEGGRRNATVRDKEIYGAECRGVYSKWLLLEVSVVSVPANQDALITAIHKGLITRSQVKAFLDIELPSDAAPPTVAIRHRISIALPARGTNEIKAAIAAREVARALGRLG